MFLQALWIRSPMINASSMAGGGGGRGAQFRAAQPVTRDPAPQFFENFNTNFTLFDYVSIDET
jgi:hypothetical protein